MVPIKVFEGERPICSGSSTWDPPAPRGQPQIEVTFEINSNGSLHVNAEDNGAGKSEKITSTNCKSRLTEEETEKVIKDAETYADEEKKVKGQHSLLKNVCGEFTCYTPRKLQSVSITRLDIRILQIDVLQPTQVGKGEHHNDYYRRVATHASSKG